MDSRAQMLSVLLQAVSDGRVTPQRAIELSRTDDPESVVQQVGEATRGETLLALSPDSAGPPSQAATLPGTGEPGGTTSGSAPVEARSLGTRYNIKREFARGGMGRVLLAMDTVVGREIAIKELLPGRTGSGRQPSTSNTHANVDRFLREARITGQLEHPNIVPVYEIGTREDGSVFYSMKFVRGETLAERLKAINSRDGDARTRMLDRLRLLDAFAQVCQAVAFAHARGVIHRDLKPSNIMLGEFGEVLVLDWGLAKVKGAVDVKGASTQHLKDDSSVQTMDGLIMGTPAYMAPEQARAESELVDEKSDVYALGAILFELVTGRPPFEGNARQIIDEVSKAGPPAPQSILPEAPPELCALVEKALARDRAQRMAGAQQLAEQVQAYRDGRALNVYQYSSGELLKRFVARNKGAVGVAAILLLALAVAGVWFWASIVAEQSRTAQERDRAIAAGDLADRNERQAREYAAKADLNARAASQSADEARREAKNAETERGKAESALAQAEVSLSHAYAEAAVTALSRMRLNDAALLAAQSLKHADNPRARAILVQARPVPLQAAYQLGIGGSCLAFSPCGRWVAAGTEDGHVVCFDRMIHEQAWRTKVVSAPSELTIQALHWGMGALYALDRKGTIAVLGHDGAVVRRESSAIGKPFTLAVNPPETLMVVSARDGAVRSVKSGRVYQEGAGIASAVALHPLGETLAIASGTTVKLMASGSTLAGTELKAGTANLTRVMFARHGTKVIAADNTGRLWIWWADGEAIADFQAGNEAIAGMDWCERLGLIACVGPENTVRLYDETGWLATELTGFEHWVTGVSFDPQGMSVAATSRDGQVRVHALGADVGNWRPHVDHEVLDLGWDDAGLYVALRDLTIHDFDSNARHPTRILRGLQRNPGGLVIGPDGAPRCFETGGVISQWQPRGGDVSRKADYLCGHEAGPASWVRDRGMACLTDEGRLVLRQGDKPRVFDATDASFWGLSASPDGSMVAGSAVDGHLYLWDIEKGSHRKWPAHQGAAMGVAFGAGRLFSTGKGEVKSWDPLTGKLLAERKLGPVTPFCLALSPRGDVLAVADETGALKLLSPASLEPLAELRPLQDFVTSLQFSRDGRRIAMAAINRQVLVLELEWLHARPAEVLAATEDRTGLKAREFGIGPGGRPNGKSGTPLGPAAADTLAGHGGSAERWWAEAGREIAERRVVRASANRAVFLATKEPHPVARAMALYRQAIALAPWPRDEIASIAAELIEINVPHLGAELLDRALDDSKDPHGLAFVWNHGAALFQRARLLPDESQADEKLTLFVQAIGAGYLPDVKERIEVAVTATAGATGHRSYDKLAVAIGLLADAVTAGADPGEVLNDDRLARLRVHRNWADLAHDLNCTDEGMAVMVVAAGNGVIDVLWTADGRYIEHEQALGELVADKGKATLQVRRYRQAEGGGIELARDKWGMPQRSITGRKMWKHEDVTLEVTPATIPALTPAILPQP
ncbi:MAG: protein kinase [Planctomycetes bacterium]|nr:protein kinase [Planctomycetota bacterium]